MRKLVLLGLFGLIGLLSAIPVAQSQTMTLVWSDKPTYDAWVPTDGGTLTFTVTVSGLFGAGISAGEVRFDFEKVSRWKGICMNEGTGTKQDLFFEFNDQDDISPLEWHRWSGGRKDSVVAKWTSDDNLDGFTIQITVRCDDYGAFGILRAQLYKSRFSIIPDNRLLECFMPIPKDDNFNYIADKSDADYGYTNPAKDAETGPSPGMGVEHNQKFGDGLVEFEEYRGFKKNRKHTRLSPARKDIFVHSEFTVFGPNPGDITTSGIGDASNLPMVFEKHEIRVDEMKPNRIVNFNSLGRPTQFGAGDSWRVQDTKALWIYQSGASGSNVLGRVSAIGSPSDVDRVDIFDQTITSLANTISLGTTGNVTVDVLENQTIGHELCHGLAVNHPWDAPVPQRDPNNANFSPHPPANAG